MWPCVGSMNLAIGVVFLLNCYLNGLYKAITFDGRMINVLFIFSSVCVNIFYFDLNGCVYHYGCLVG